MSTKLSLNIFDGFHDHAALKILAIAKAITVFFALSDQKIHSNLF